MIASEISGTDLLATSRDMKRRPSDVGWVVTQHFNSPGHDPAYVTRSDTTVLVNRTTHRHRGMDRRDFGETGLLAPRR